MNEADDRSKDSGNDMSVYRDLLSKWLNRWGYNDISELDFAAGGELLSFVQYLELHDPRRDTWIEFAELLEFLDLQEKKAKSSYADSEEDYWQGYETAISDVRERLPTMTVAP